VNDLDHVAAHKLSFSQLLLLILGMQALDQFLILLLLLLRLYLLLELLEELRAIVSHVCISV
jgi:hypothetical protein